NRRVDLLLPGLPAQDEAAAWTAQRFVRRRGDEVGKGHRVLVLPAGDQPRNVGHVHHEQRTHLLAHLGEGRELDGPRVSAGPGDDQLRLVLPGQCGDLIEVDLLGVAANAVAGDLEVLAGEVEAHTVRQVAAVGQVHGHDGVAGVQ